MDPLFYFSLSLIRKPIWCFCLINIIGIWNVNATANDAFTPLETQAIRLLTQQATPQAQALNAQINIKLADNFKQLVQKAACPNPFISLSEKSKSLGRTQLTLSCPNNNWSSYINAYIALMKAVPVSNRNIKAGEILNGSDWSKKEVDISAWSKGVILNEESINGLKTSRSIRAGEPIPPTSLETQRTLDAGQRVMITLYGKGFSLDTSGVTLQAGFPGDIIRIKLDTNKIISGKIGEDHHIYVEMN